MAIEHCVFIRRSAFASDEDIAKIYHILEQITERLTGASNFRYGANISPENLDRSYRDGFIIRFDNAAARDVYLADKEHQRAGALLVSLCENEADGLLVFDLAF